MSGAASRSVVVIFTVIVDRIYLVTGVRPSITYGPTGFRSRKPFGVRSVNVVYCYCGPRFVPTDHRNLFVYGASRGHGHQEPIIEAERWGEEERTALKRKPANPANPAERPAGCSPAFFFFNVRRAPTLQLQQPSVKSDFTADGA